MKRHLKTYWIQGSKFIYEGKFFIQLVIASCPNQLLSSYFKPLLRKHGVVFILHT